jgi:hypothetical protein
MVNTKKHSENIQIYHLKFCDETPSINIHLAFGVTAIRIVKAENFKFCLGQIINIPTDSA